MTSITNIKYACLNEPVNWLRILGKVTAWIIALSIVGLYVVLNIRQGNL